MSFVSTKCAIRAVRADTADSLIYSLSIGDCGDNCCAAWPGFISGPPLRFNPLCVSYNVVTVFSLFWSDALPTIVRPVFDIRWCYACVSLIIVDCGLALDVFAARLARVVRLKRPDAESIYVSFRVSALNNLLSRILISGEVGDIGMYVGISRHGGDF